MGRLIAARRRGAVLCFALTTSCARDPGAAAEVAAESAVEVAADSVLPSFADTLTSGWAIDTVARGLEVPWGIAMLPDGRILVTERVGRIRVITRDGLDDRPWATLDVHASDPNWGPETGLMGIAPAPDFAASGEVFVMVTVRPGAPLARELPFESRVIRLTERGGRGMAPTAVLGGLPATHYHAGGGVAFGPDGMLYVSVGDAMQPKHVSDLSSPLGKILRVTRTGGIPPDNPDPRSAVWARGLRNTQAFTWMDDGTMLGLEHGPSGMPQEGGRRGHDELNILLAGGDYGWPRVIGWPSGDIRGDIGGDSSRAPAWTWRAGNVPTGIVVYRGPRRAWQGRVLVGGLRGRLELLDLARSDAAYLVRSRALLLDGFAGRLRALAQDAQGAIYLTTSNRDARGTPRPGDDLLLRLRPRP